MSRRSDHAGGPAAPDSGYRELAPDCQRRTASLEERIAAAEEQLEGLRAGVLPEVDRRRLAAARREMEQLRRGGDLPSRAQALETYGDRLEQVIRSLPYSLAEFTRPPAVVPEPHTLMRGGFPGRPHAVEPARRKGPLRVMAADLERILANLDPGSTLWTLKGKRWWFIQSRMAICARLRCNDTPLSLVWHQLTRDDRKGEMTLATSVARGAPALVMEPRYSIFNFGRQVSHKLEDVFHFRVGGPGDGLPREVTEPLWALVEWEVPWLTVEGCVAELTITAQSFTLSLLKAAVRILKVIREAKVLTTVSRNTREASATPR